MCIDSIYQELKNKPAITDHDDLKDLLPHIGKAYENLKLKVLQDEDHSSEALDLFELATLLAKGVKPHEVEYTDKEPEFEQETGPKFQVAKHQEDFVKNWKDPDYLRDHVEVLGEFNTLAEAHEFALEQEGKILVLKDYRGAIIYE